MNKSNYTRRVSVAAHFGFSIMIESDDNIEFRVIRDGKVIDTFQDFDSAREFALVTVYALAEQNDTLIYD